ncbi:hypothetical protein Tco_0749328 [Tanacetum coccineum]|uniref:Uncharacterized protein n=1 Tax=Tanacetum coccineum TaxID=301880 RepID=A0ABQ4YYV3_9ASTR
MQKFPYLKKDGMRSEGIKWQVLTLLYNLFPLGMIMWLVAMYGCARDIMKLQAKLGNPFAFVLVTLVLAKDCTWLDSQCYFHLPTMSIQTLRLGSQIDRKLDLKKWTLKWQMAMLFCSINNLSRKSWKDSIDFDKKESARFNKRGQMDAIKEGAAKDIQLDHSEANTKGSQYCSDAGELLSRGSLLEVTLMPLVGTINHTDLDESQMSYGTKSSISGDSNSVSNDFVSCDNSDKSSEVNSNDFASSDSRVKSSEPNTHLIKDCDFYEKQNGNKTVVVLGNTLENGFYCGKSLFRYEDEGICLDDVVMKKVSRIGGNFSGKQGEAKGQKNRVPPGFSIPEVPTWFVLASQNPSGLWCVVFTTDSPGCCFSSSSNALLWDFSSTTIALVLQTPFYLFAGNMVTERVYKVQQRSGGIYFYPAITSYVKEITAERRFELVTCQVRTATTPFEVKKKPIATNVPACLQACSRNQVNSLFFQLEAKLCKVERRFSLGKIHNDVGVSFWVRRLISWLAMQEAKKLWLPLSNEAGMLAALLLMWMLDHQLEICHGTVGNELTTAVQLIAFLKKQISDSKRPKVHEWVIPIRPLESCLSGGLLRWFKVVAVQVICCYFNVAAFWCSSSTRLLIFGSKAMQTNLFDTRSAQCLMLIRNTDMCRSFMCSSQDSSRLDVAVKYVVPTGRVVIPNGIYVVPAGKVIIIVSPGRLNRVPTGRILSPGSDNDSDDASFPYLKKDEYEVWAMKMEYWITNNDMNIWKVIQNGNSLKRTRRDYDGRVIILPPTTADEHIAVQRESKARTTLLQFGGNAESKKMRKSMLKQEFSEFRISEAEGLHKGYDRMQKILSQLNQLKAKPEDEDINLKFLRALPSSWSQVALTLKTKGGLELRKISPALQLIK